MSARFGRNQRRKMREAHAAELAMQAMLLRMSQAALADQSEAYHREKGKRVALEQELTEWARRILLLLGEDSAFARHMAVTKVHAPVMASAKAGRPMRLNQLPPLASLVSSGPVPLRVALQTVEAFAVFAEARRDDLAYRVRFLIEGPDGARALMVDQSTLYRLRDGSEAGLRRYLAEALVDDYLAASKRKAA
jgi:hypothetical protein